MVFISGWTFQVYSSSDKDLRFGGYWEQSEVVFRWRCGQPSESVQALTELTQLGTTGTKRGKKTQKNEEVDRTSLFRRVFKVASLANIRFIVLHV